MIGVEVKAGGAVSSGGNALPPTSFAPLSGKFPGAPFALPPSGPITTAVVATAVQPVNAAITMATPRLRRAPLLKLNRGPQVPPIIVSFTRKSTPPARVQPKKQRLVTGMLPGKGLSGIPPMSHIHPRLVRLQVRPKGSISGPLKPATVTIVTPILPIVLRAPRRGPPRPPSLARSVYVIPNCTYGFGAYGSGPYGTCIAATVIPSPYVLIAPARKVQRQPRMSLRIGMLPGKGLSGIPPMPVLRNRQARAVPLRVFNVIRPGQRGSLTVPIPVPIKLQDKRRIRPVPQRLIRGERGSLTVPSVPVPIVLRNRNKIRPVTSRLVPGIVIPPFSYPAQPQPTIKVRTQYRLQRQPRQSLTIGMLPGKGLSGIPPAGHIRSRAARLVTRNSGTLRAGQRGSLTVPVPVPITLRDKRKVRPVPQRLTYPFFISSVVVYPSVSAPTIKVSTRYRLQCQPRMSLRTGMLPGKGLSGIPVQQTRSKPAVVQRQPRQQIRTGFPASLTVPVPVPVVLRHRNRVLRATSRLIPSPFAPAGVVFQPVIQQHYLVKPVWRLVRAPRMQLRTGMLPGTGLSGIPPSGHVRPRQAKAVPNVRSRIVPGPVIPISLGARPSSKPVLRYKLVRRDAGRLRVGMLPGKGLSGLPPTGHARALPPRKIQRKPSERIRTGWPAWGFIFSLPGKVTVTHALTNTVSIVNVSATVVISDQNVSAVHTDNTSASVTISNALASRADAKNSETSL